VALRRVLDHYLRTACAASELLYPYRDLITLSPPGPLTKPEELAGREQALDWFQAEFQVLLGLIRLAAASGFDAYAWQLPWAAAVFLDWRGYWHELAAIQELALAAAERLRNPAGQAKARQYMAQAKIRLGAYPEAGTHLAAVLELGRQLGSSVTQARAHIDLGRVEEIQGRSLSALGHAQESLRLYQAAGHRPGEANALNAIGWCQAQLGRYRDAIGSCTQALAVYRELGNRPAEATTLDTLGYAHHQLGQHAEAIACCQQAIDAQGAVGDLGNRADMLIHLGDAHHASGDSESARRAWQQALAILDDLDEPAAAAAEVRSRLASDA
jgi:tetratricopeptide (TPR) repeat protein